MKRLLVTLGVGTLLFGGLAGSCGISAARVARAILNTQYSILNFDSKLFGWCFNGLPLVDKLVQILDNKNYIIILQNNMELRPTGGFMGSYAVLSTQYSGLRDVKIEDIYVPDGQLVGHVDPPPPIQQAFGQGWWKLRDSNWDPDFTAAAPQIAWFFEQGLPAGGQGNEKVDGIIAVNLQLVTSLLGILGEIKPTDYGDVVTAKTFYNLAQKYAEENFFPGSTQKRDFLGAVGNALFKRIKQSGPIEQIKLVKLVWQELKKGEILVWFKDPALQEVIKQRHWDGGLGPSTGSGFSDYLYIVETNLGANKANCCINRQVTQEIDNFQTKLTIKYQNNNLFENPKPPVFWGGNYINYLRIIIGKSASIKSVKVGDKQLVEKPLDNVYGIQEDRYQAEDRGEFKIIGFWAVVPAQSSVIAELEYESVRPAYRTGRAGEDKILVRRQPGMDPFPYKLVVDGKVVVSDTIDRDKEYTIKK